MVTSIPFIWSPRPLTYNPSDTQQHVFFRGLKAVEGEKKGNRTFLLYSWHLVYREKPIPFARSYKGHSAMLIQILRKHCVTLWSNKSLQFLKTRKQNLSGSFFCQLPYLLWTLLYEGVCWVHPICSSCVKIKKKKEREKKAKIRNGLSFQHPSLYKIQNRILSFINITQCIKCYYFISNWHWGSTS